MSWEASAWAMRQKLPCMTKMVLIALSDHHNKVTGQCNPGIKLLAEEAGLAISTAKKHLALLAKDEFITIVEGKRSDGSRTSSHYTLNIWASTPEVWGHTPGIHHEPGIEPGDAPSVPSSDSEESSSVTMGVSTKRKTEITEDFLNAMHTKYPQVNVDYQLFLARAHKSWTKWDGKQQYFENWLKRVQSAEPQAGTKGRDSPSRGGTVAEESERIRIQKERWDEGRRLGLEREAELRARAQTTGSGGGDG